MTHRSRMLLLMRYEIIARCNRRGTFGLIGQRRNFDKAEISRVYGYHISTRDYAILRSRYSIIYDEKVKHRDCKK